MIEGTLEYIDHQRDSMQPDEWLSYLEALRTAINARIEAASADEPDEPDSDKV